MDNSSTKPFAIITGASSGTGYELAKQFAQHGFDLLIAAEDQGIAAAAQKLESMDSTKVKSLQVDLVAYDGVEKLYGAIKSSGRPVDAIAIHAGVGLGGDFARGTDLNAELNL